MAYLDAAKKAAILADAKVRENQKDLTNLIVDETAAAILADASALANMPAVPGDVEANKIAQLGANSELDEVHAEALYIGAAAGTLVTSTAAELNVLAGYTGSAADVEAVSGMETELGLLSGLTSDAAALNAITSAPGLVALAGIRIEAAVEDEETVTIGADVFEFDTHDAETLANAGAIAVDVSGGTTVKAQGTLTVDTQPTAGDDMTIGSTVYTFVPDGTANAAGEIDIGTDLASAKVAITAAVDGTDGYNVDHTQCSFATWATNDLVITALAGGTAGNALASTENFTAGTNVFDAATLGTTLAGVDPTAGEASDALITTINASGTEGVIANDIDANEILLVMDTVGIDTTALAEDMGGANNEVDAAFDNGASAGAGLSIASVDRVPTAQEVATGNMHIALDFTPTIVFTQVRTTATGALIAWDGAAAILTGGNPYITIDNAGGTDWSTAETVYVMAFA